MKLQKQRWNNNIYGDCFSACVASLLDLDLNIFPKYTTETFDEYIRWFKNDLGYIFVDVIYDKYIFDKTDSVLIVTGDSPNYEHSLHSVLWYKGKLFFDPSKSGKGLKGEPHKVSILQKRFMEDK